MVRLLHYQYNIEVSPIWKDLFINNLILKSSHIGTTLLKMLIKVVSIWHDSQQHRSFSMLARLQHILIKITWCWHDFFIIKPHHLGTTYPSLEFKKKLHHFGYCINKLHHYGKKKTQVFYSPMLKGSPKAMKSFLRVLIRLSTPSVKPEKIK